MNIYQSITKILEEVPAIGKNKKSDTQHFKYRGIDDVMNAFQPIFAKNKVFIVPQVLEQKREERITSRGVNLIYSICKIKYTFYAEDGSNVEAIVIGEGMDSGDKATNKAMAIAMKYAMFQVFCIPTEEMKDPDGETPPESKPKQVVIDISKDTKITPTQIKVIAQIYAGENLEKLLKANGLEKLQDMSMTKASEIIKKVNEKRKEKENGTN